MAQDQENDFNKDSRAKTPRRKEKYFIFFFSELGVPFDLAQGMLCARSNPFLPSHRRKIKNV
ncbi:MAG TPA: hypothetical protein VEG60_17300 [Candidatus Binatia bacterium]|nr:hypothetical protein [Candidatus Binatia bacterium]